MLALTETGGADTDDAAVTKILSKQLKKEDTLAIYNEQDG